MYMCIYTIDTLACLSWPMKQTRKSAIYPQKRPLYIPQKEPHILKVCWRVCVCVCVGIYASDVWRHRALHTGALDTLQH